MTKRTGNIVFWIVLGILLIGALEVISGQQLQQQDQAVQDIMSQQSLLMARYQANFLAVGIHNMLKKMVQDPKLRSLVEEGNITLGNNGYRQLQVQLPPEPAEGPTKKAAEKKKKGKK